MGVHKLLLLATAASLVHEIKADNAATTSTCVSPPEPGNDFPDNSPPDTYVQNLIQWLQSKNGGFFSPKINYGNLDKDNTFFSGIFAVAPIAKGEEIIHLPAEQFITGNDFYDFYDEDSFHDDEICETAGNLLKEYRKGKESDWEPYVTYLFESFPHKHLPPNWSEDAMDLFEVIIEEDLKPQDIGDVGAYEYECEETEDNLLELEAAYRIVVSKGWNEILLPVVDMINHRNGKWHNAGKAGSAHTGEDISVVALKEIKVGEQIYLSYNECSNGDCTGIAQALTMPQILAHRGFVEQYPRRFDMFTYFDSPVFELDKDEDGEIEITWLERQPTSKDLYWFRTQYDRLLELEDSNYVERSLKVLKSYEQYTINAYFQAMLEGLEYVLKWAEEHPKVIPKVIDDLPDRTISDAHVQNLIQWLQSKKGGFFSPKINYGNRDEDNTFFSGIFAVAPIAKGEEIIHLPVEQFITGNIGNDNDSFSNDMCETAVNLAAEYRKGKESDWEPYVTYLFESFPHEHLPLNWSKKATNLFKYIIAGALEPQFLLTQGKYQNYCGKTEDSLLETAYSIVVSKGWNEILLPVVDMINHRNGKWYNADKAGSAHTGEDISVVALRNIEEGEPIYLSYNDCSNGDCIGISQTLTMPQIFADNGFVEQYPRRFNISDSAPVFELDKDDGVVEISWLNVEPTSTLLDWFKDVHKHFLKICDYVEETLEELKSYEKYAINAYFQAMLEGLDYVLKWGKQTEIYVHPDRYRPRGKQVSKEKFRSIYQGIEFFKYTDSYGDTLDTCLWFDNYALHACTSQRPHYHEWFVHYPAQFLKQIKRVLFLGGGDSMILHEVLKYPDLELVIGMELDQTVVRGSFKHFKTEPHFDDDRVQWWFGDAARSLKMIPDEYLGTFDLVVVDLLTEVIDILKVTTELNILDFSMLLLNEGGILTMNDEFIVATKSENSQYSVDLEVMDMPVFCQQSIKMLSNSVDFMAAEPIDHGVESIVVQPGVTKKDSKKFESWWNYHRNTQHKLKERKAVTVDASSNSEGVMIVLEAEETTQSLDSLTDLNETLTKSLEKKGLSVLSSSSFEKEALVIILKEGYVVLRSWPEHRYCAFDLVLWSSLDRLGAVRDELVAAVGAEVTSSYNIVIGGMKGVAAVEIPKFPADTNPDSSAKIDQQVPAPKAFELGDLDKILKETISLMQRVDPTTIVFCPGEAKSCQSLEALKDGEVKVLPIRCASGGAIKRDISCESTTLDVMKSALSVGKINAIVIDPAAPSGVSLVLKKILSNVRRKELLAAQFVLLAPGLKSHHSWYSPLFEWFRTDVRRMSPSHHAEVLFSSPTRSGKLRMGIFSAGDVDFYPHLVDFTEKCESKYGLQTEIPRVLDGKPKKMECFNPLIVANESSYDKTTADSQWESQNPLGMQTVSQFETGIPGGPLRVGDRVLGSIDMKVKSGTWYPATVTSVNKYGTFDLKYDDTETELDMPRHFIRKMGFSGDASVNDEIMVRRPLSDFDNFYFGKVLDKRPNNKYMVHIHDAINMTEVVDRHDIAAKMFMSQVSCTMLMGLLRKAVASNESWGSCKLELHGRDTIDGCVATALWPQGNAVAVWDGGTKLDLNLFTFEEDKQIHETFSEAFLEAKSFGTLSFGRMFQNQHPRGSGRVVNFKQEMNFNLSPQ